MMIESRYKIEYIFPDTETKKTSSFRGLFLLPLIPLLVLILLDFTNDYTFEDLAEDSSSLIENVKTNILNLGGNSLIQNTKSENLKKTAPMINIAEPNNEDKALISKLQKKEKAQSESIQTEIAKNDKLTKELTELSKQLTLEKEKNQKLNIQLAEQKHTEQNISSTPETSTKKTNNNKSILEKAPSNIKTSFTSEKIQDTEESIHPAEKEIMYTVASSSTQAVSYTEKNIVTQKSKTPISVAKNDMQIASSPEDKLTNTINKSEITKDKAKITKDSTSDTKKENKPEVSSSAVDDIIAAMQNSKAK